MEIQELERILHGRRIRPTAMRLLVLDALLKQQSAISLTQLELDLGHTDRVTVYRTIKTFEQYGLVHKVQDGNGTDKFALCADQCSEGGHDDLHVHFTCTDCNETFCLPKISIPPITLPRNYQAVHSELIVKGRCPAC